MKEKYIVHHSELKNNFKMLRGYNRIKLMHVKEIARRSVEKLANIISFETQIP